MDALSLVPPSERQNSVFMDLGAQQVYGVTPQIRDSGVAFYARPAPVQDVLTAEATDNPGEPGYTYYTESGDEIPMPAEDTNPLVGGESLSGLSTVTERQQCKDASNSRSGPFRRLTYGDSSKATSWMHAKIILPEYSAYGQSGVKGNPLSQVPDFLKTNEYSKISMSQYRDGTKISVDTVPYIYAGGWSATGGGSVDAGFQASTGNDKIPFSKFGWTLFIREGAIGGYTYRSFKDAAGNE
ncbi:hypothetical protein, partial [Deinococcus sp.]|uniref:hypothetical protein n=1 Tax=Deinococcus sp. TaxID=47478 RepID=UPI0025FD77D9